MKDPTLKQMQEAEFKALGLFVKAQHMRELFSLPKMNLTKFILGYQSGRRDLAYEAVTEFNAQAEALLNDAEATEAARIKQAAQIKGLER